MIQPPKPMASSIGAQPIQASHRNNWNPFSLKPGLDFAAFVATLTVISTIELTFGWWVQIPLHAAKLHVDQKQIAILYGAWALVSILGFFSAANTFIKRWITIFGFSEAPWWMKTFSRLVLMSPLLSLWATLYTLMYSAEALLFRDRDARWAIVYRALATLFVFHVAFLGYRMIQHEVSYRGTSFVLREETSMRDSLPASYVRDMWLPGQQFYIHAYPYLSPLTKLGLSVYGDFVRAKIINDQVGECTTGYIGQKVPNCFLTAYHEVALKRPFVTPAFGVIYEMQYRQAMMKTLQPKTSLQAFAFNAITIENLLVFLEPNDMVYERRKFLKPIGMLGFYGSPELPAIAIGQDGQHFVLSAKLVPLIAPQITKLEQSVEQMKAALTTEDDRVINAKLIDLRARLKALEADPLALR